MPEFIPWFPDTKHGPLNVMDFGADGDGTGRTLNSVGFASVADAKNGVGGNGKAYPSATDINDYIDWCAITECFKQAFQHETSPGVWEPNATQADLNKPVFLPAGRYVIGKPLRWDSIQGGWIYGSGGGTNIHNEVGTPGNSSCVITNGFCYCRIENINFGTVGGEAAAHAFDLNWGTGALTAANACTFSNCHFSAPDGIGISFADPASFPGSGNMASEVHFWHCTMNGCAVGIYVAAANALNYSFIGCGGISNTTSWLQVSAGGMVTVMNGSLAANALDIDIGADTATIISTRTESRRFVKVGGGGASLISCTMTAEGNDNVFCEARSPVYMANCVTTMGRLSGIGPVTIDNCTFNANVTWPITSIVNSPTTPGLIRVTHQAGSTGSEQLWLDGDEVWIELVTGSGAASVNGVWIINKIAINVVDLVGSVFGGTYTLSGGARIRPGPRYHLRDNIITMSVASDTAATAIPRRSTAITRTKDLPLLWLDSGSVIDNYKATGPVTITLPSLNVGTRRGARFEFVVLAAQTLTVKVNNEFNPAVSDGSPRIVEAGAPPTQGQEISSNMVGATLEVYLADHDDYGIEPAVYGQRWVVTRKTGTWTLAVAPTEP